MKKEERKKLYLAGGWFTPEQEEEHTRLYKLLTEKTNLNVFNPRLEGEIDKFTSKNDMDDILLGNCFNLDTANVVLVIYDGKDTGTIWEAGYAYAKSKPIIYYAEKLNGKKFNLMLAKTGYFASNEEELLKLLNSDLKYSDIYDSYKGVIE